MLSASSSPARRRPVEPSVRVEPSSRVVCPNASLYCDQPQPNSIARPLIPGPHCVFVRSTLSSQHLLVKHYNSVYPVTGTFLCFGSCCTPCCGQPGSASCIIPSSPQGVLVPAAASIRPAVAKANTSSLSAEAFLRLRLVHVVLHPNGCHFFRIGPQKSIQQSASKHGFTVQGQTSATLRSPGRYCTIRLPKTCLAAPSHRGCGTAPR
ncbi:hypothetical protein P171DRAFT_204666 [Karstenula rhodostoma CBS 690.94]|uniref:Uncharacterized protein n=1 Tax=Karstenula rhodostoma CBS 690.94 TaxID=1392251 RepID=A0A9P4UI99_9PLEO|nr:hypothetical protein P171DRAFT_204666 [Karstenula rhodostoma CBS 690.94]